MMVTSMKTIHRRIEDLERERKRRQGLHAEIEALLAQFSPEEADALMEEVAGSRQEMPPATECPTLCCSQRIMIPR